MSSPIGVHIDEQRPERTSVRRNGRLSVLMSLVK